MGGSEVNETAFHAVTWFIRNRFPAPKPVLTWSKAFVHVIGFYLLLIFL